MRRWIRPIVITFIILSPLLLLIALLQHFAVNVPFWDQWELVTIFEKCFNGTLSFADFFAQHNEHRIVFPRLIMFTLAVYTHWNTLYEVVTNVVLAAGTFSVLWLLLRRTFVNKKLLYSVAFLVSLIFFSPDQFENWMWGWQIQWFSNVLGLVVAVWALTALQSKSPALRLALAIAGGVLATYSLGSGFFVWLVAAPLLWFSRDLKKYLYVWIAAGLIAVGIHYMGYVDPAYHPSKFLFLQQPLGFLAYFLVYIGRPLVIDFLTSIPIAIVYLSAVAGSLMYVIKKHASHITTTLLPWLSIGAYSICAGLSTDLSRLGFGVEQAYSSRYITLSCLLLIASVVIVFKIIELTGKKNSSSQLIKRLSACFIVITLLFVGINYAKGIQQMRERHTYLLSVLDCARNATSQDDPCLLKLYPNKETVWPRLQYLRSIHWGGL